MMYPLQFRVITPRQFDVIRVVGVPVYLTVYPASHPLFLPSLDERQYYCYSANGLLVFKTTGYTKFIDPFHLQALYAAIKWYGRGTLAVDDIEIRLTNLNRSRPAN